MNAGLGIQRRLELLETLGHIELSPAALYISSATSAICKAQISVLKKGPWSTGRHPNPCPHRCPRCWQPKGGRKPAVAVGPQGPKILGAAAPHFPPTIILI